MTRIRAFFLHYRALAFAVVAVTLMMKAVVPAGTMIGSDAHSLAIRLCDGSGEMAARVVVLAVKPAVQQHGDAGKAPHEHQACAFSGLGHGALGGADPVQLALLLAFIMALGFAATALPGQRRTAWLWPPLRGPPVRSYATT